MRISIVAALSENHVIGVEGRIPWRIVSDYKRFRDLTLGHVMIIGRKEYETLRKLYERTGKQTMSQRTQIVITRQKDYKVLPNDFVAHTIEDAIRIAKENAEEKHDSEVFVAGGAQIFKQILPYVDRLYLTLVKGEYAGDAFFPDYSMFTKKIEETYGEDKGMHYTFLTLER